jgi:hypothetical protein
VPYCGDRVTFVAFLEDEKTPCLDFLLWAAVYAPLLMTVWLSNIVSFWVLCELVPKPGNLILSALLALSPPFCFFFFSWVEMDHNIHTLYSSGRDNIVSQAGRLCSFQYLRAVIEAVIGTLAYALSCLYGAHGTFAFIEEEGFVPERGRSSFDQIVLPFIVVTVCLAWFNQAMTKGIAYVDHIAGFRSKAHNAQQGLWGGDQHGSEVCGTTLFRGVIGLKNAILQRCFLLFQNDPLVNVFSQYREKCSQNSLTSGQHLNFGLTFGVATLDVLNTAALYYKGAVVTTLYILQLAEQVDSMDADLGVIPNMLLGVVGVIGAKLYYSFTTKKFVENDVTKSLTGTTYLDSGIAWLFSPCRNSDELGVTEPLLSGVGSDVVL